jgi:hypothetical protein
MPPAYVDEEQIHIEKTSKTDPALKPQFISKVEEIVDSDLPPYAQAQYSSGDPTEEDAFPAQVKPDFRKLATDFSEDEIRASMGKALQLAAENYFRGGAFEKAMTDTIHRVATIQTTYHYGRDSESSSDNEEPEESKSFGSSVNDLAVIHSGHGRRASLSRICHKTSATGTLFGTVWLRTTSVSNDRVPNNICSIPPEILSFKLHFVYSLGDPMQRSLSPLPPEPI